MQKYWAFPCKTTLFYTANCDKNHLPSVFTVVLSSIGDEGLAGEPCWATAADIVDTHGVEFFVQQSGGMLGAAGNGHATDGHRSAEIRQFCGGKKAQKKKKKKSNVERGNLDSPSIEKEIRRPEARTESRLGKDVITGRSDDARPKNGYGRKRGKKRSDVGGFFRGILVRGDLCRVLVWGWSGRALPKGV